MTTRAVGPGHGWSWLVRAVNLGSHNAKALFGAAAILLVIAMVPTAIQLLLQQTMGGDSMRVMGASMALAFLYSMLVMPPAMAGFLRVIHACETGVPTRATALFDGYRSGAGRIIALVVILMLAAVAILAAILLLFGTSMMTGLSELIVAAQTSTPGDPSALPQLPEGFGTLLVVLLLFGLFFNGVYALSIGQLVLGDRSIGQALRDGLTGAIKNLLPLLVLLVIAVVVGLVAGLVLALVMGLLGVVGGLVHPLLGLLLVAPLYVFVLLAIYVIAFGVMYHMWRDVCGDGAAVAQAPRDDQLEV